LSAKPTYDELAARVAQLEELLDKRTKELSQEIADYVIIQSDLEKKSFELNQRIRELKSVLLITTAADQPNRSLDEFYHSILDIIIESFQYPDITCAELKIGDQVFCSRNYSLTDWKIGRGLMEDNKMIGYLTVCYTEERPVKDFGLFTREEKNLLVLISRYLVQIIRRKQTEAELEKFQHVISQSQVMILIMNHSGQLEYVNENLIRVMGYTRQEIEEMQGIMATRDPLGVEAYKKINRALEKHGKFAGELQVETKQGRKFWTRAWITEVSKQNKPEYYVGMFEDISEEIELKRLNQEHQELLNKIMENLPVSVTLMDRDGYFTYLNKEAENHLRVSRKVLKSTPINVLLPGEGDRTLESIRKIFQDKQPISAEVVYKINGADNYFQVSRFPLLDKDGNVQNVISLVYDITRKKHEEKLQKIQRAIDSLQSIGENFEESLRILFDNLFELDWLDSAGLYLINKEKELLELVYHRGLSEKFLKKVSVYPYESMNTQIVFKGEPSYANVDNYILPSRDDISKENIKLVIVLPLLYLGQVIGSLNLGSKKISELDSEDKLALENIAVKIANLLEVIRTREQLTTTNLVLVKNINDLKEKQDLLLHKSKLESLGEIAAGLAHEINQPLSVISLAFENIIYKLQQTKSQTDYFVKKSEVISMNIEKIRELIDQIRLFSRKETALIYEKVDLHQAIRNSLSFLDIQLKKHRIDITVDLFPEGCYILGNQTKVEQVIMNLLSNAKDAVDEKAKTARDTDYRKAIRVTTMCMAGEVVLVVEDNGTGISEENLSKIFNPFFTTKPPGKGTGLGLLIVYGIVTEMQGKIEISSKINTFTRAAVILPRI